MGSDNGGEEKPKEKNDDKKAPPSNNQVSRPTGVRGTAPGGDGQKSIKLVLVGDTSVGKSCLITNYLHNSFTEDYEPTVLDVYRGIKAVKKYQLNIEIHDTSGDEHLGVNRKVQYRGADCFMICVACNNQESLDNVNRWKVEIQDIEATKPIMLVLTKSNLMEELEGECVDMTAIKKEAQKHGFQGSAKTSSKEWNDFNVHQCFNRTLATAYQYKYE